MLDIVQAVGNFIVEDLKPISLVDGKGFSKLMKVAEPRFKIPSRTYFSQSVIPGQYIDLRRKVEAFLSTVKFCSITTDIWTAKYQTKGYLSLTCHSIDSEWTLRSTVLSTGELTADHTAQNISDALGELLCQWNIQEKVVASTTDNARNISNAMRNLNILSIPCVGHTLQLSVIKSFELPIITRMLSRLRKIVGHFHRSEKATRNLCEKQKQLGVPVHKLINDCVTRWGSTYSMLNRYIEQQQPICAVFLENRDARQFMPSDDEISAAEELVAVLEIFQRATEIVSGEKYPTLGIVQPLLQKLLFHTLAESLSDKPLSKNIKEVIRKDLSSRYQGNDIKSMLYMAMYLDPRFKDMSFVDNSTKSDIKEDVKVELLKLIEQEEISTDPEGALPPGPTETPPPKKTKLTTFFEGMIESTSGSEQLSSVDIASNEIKRYDAEEHMSLDQKEPLKWWKMREHRLKYMSQLVKKTLCITASSVPSERLFSSAGNLVNQKRSSLSPENVDSLLFLHENLSENLY